MDKLCHEYHRNIPSLVLNAMNVHTENTFQKDCPYFNFVIFPRYRVPCNDTMRRIFTISNFFWISYDGFKIRSKRLAWTFVGRGWILQNYWCISDEIGTCVPKKDFYKKCRANYEALIVQIWPVSCWICIDLSFYRELDEKLLARSHLIICTSNVVW